MLGKFVYVFLIILGGTLGFLYGPDLALFLNISGFSWATSPYFTSLVFAFIFFTISYFVVDYIVGFFKWVEEGLVNLPVADLFFGTIGLIIGLVVAYLINIPLKDVGLQIVSEVIPLFTTLVVGYLGFQVGFRRRDEFTALYSQREKVKIEPEDVKESEPEILTEVRPKILDTSVIIDGRIADICQTNFLEGPIIIPKFILDELQHIADSSDALKRNRGRRGLDILNKIQKELPVEVQIYDGDFEDVPEVDSKLVRLAQEKDGTVVTNDFNLNKVADLQGVLVLNINDLANAVKPVVIPGEPMTVQVIKDGKEQGQGVAYLDDGTMIVVEEGKSLIGQTVDVIITSVLQTSAGRMIFAKPK